MTIQTASYRRIRIPLRQPYVLSFTTVREVVSQQLWIRRKDGGVGAGEAVALVGYSEDTEASIESVLQQLANDLSGQTYDAARTMILSFRRQSPFACSAAMTAMEFSNGEVAFPDIIDVPLLAAVAADSPTLLEDVARRLGEGFGTIKVKIGRDLQADLHAVEILTDAFTGRATFRFDANQAYNLSAAQRFCDLLARKDTSAVELLEQPFGVHAWEETAILTSQTPVPIMLDESIFNIADIDRAVDVGAKLVKLKLFKHAGITELLQLATHAHQRRLGVVLGNGVSGDVGNLAEGAAYCLGKDLFAGACEANGFAKLQSQTLQFPPRLEGGRMHWQKPAGVDALVPAEAKS